MCGLCNGRTHSETRTESRIVVASAPPCRDAILVEEVVSFTLLLVSEDGRDFSKAREPLVDSLHVRVFIRAKNESL